MKARIPPATRIRRADKKNVDEYLRQEGTALMRRFLKLALVVLNQDFGFGSSRALRFMEAVGELAKEAAVNEDKGIWEKIDRFLESKKIHMQEEDYASIEG